MEGRVRLSLKLMDCLHARLTEQNASHAQPPNEHDTNHTASIASLDRSEHVQTSSPTVSNLLYVSKVIYPFCYCWFSVTDIVTMWCLVRVLRSSSPLLRDLLVRCIDLVSTVAAATSISVRCCVCCKSLTWMLRNNGKVLFHYRRHFDFVFQSDYCRSQPQK